MNERIRELAHQARQIGEYGNYGQIELSHTQFEQKFAELMVQECVQVCLSQRDPANLNYKPSERFAEAVKQHFGVEE
jgi:hypothetical protein